MAQICKTDMEAIFCYLEDAAKIYVKSESPRQQNRARLITKLINKLKKL